MGPLGMSCRTSCEEETTDDNSKGFGLRVRV